MSQADVIAFLSSENGHPGGGPVETVETHGALVFLAGESALKIKREVKYDYMDLSTLSQREAVLRRELELNQPVAPKIYHDVVALTRDANGTLALDGTGEPVEWVLRMWRFPKEAELAVIASARGIDDDLAQNLGTAIHRYHTKAPWASANGTTLISDILAELDRVFAEMHHVFGPDRVAAFNKACQSALDHAGTLLNRRARDGHVRRCHGDLHLRNLVLLDGMPVPFDALEFDEVLGTCDVLYDLAFLVMDLHQRNLDRAANVVLSSYLLEADGTEDGGLAALPLFLAVRAAIRAMVAVQTSSATHRLPGTEPISILENALDFLNPLPPKLVLIGGLSGTGKTTGSRALASEIGATPGAVHLRTDLERKKAIGLPSTEPAPPTAYSASGRGAVYSHLFDRAETILVAGHSVLIDATFLDKDLRARAYALAQRSKAELQAIWLEAPLEVLVDRVSRRSGDASDADETVVRSQQDGSDTPDDWLIVPATGTQEQTIARVRHVLNMGANAIR